MYLTKKEITAVLDAQELVRNALEGCIADEETEEGKETLDVLNNTISGLNSIIKKYHKQMIER